MSEYSASRAANLVREFDSSGVHRASTSGDYASGEWLCEAARTAGARVEQMPVDLARIVVEEACIECAGQRIDGLPMFDSPPAPAAGIEGTLGECGTDCDVGFIELPPNSASIRGMRFETMRRASKHAAIVVATRVSGESLAPINAQYFDAPFGPPVLLVAGMHHAFLAEHARHNTRITLVARHRREAARSYNVAARIAAGSPRGTVVLLTPRTGWWESTAERAGGLVAWLAGLHAAASIRDRLTHDVYAVATCGHELGHVGLHDLLAREGALLQTSIPWLHLGANLGSASPQMMLRASDPAQAERMRERLSREGYAAELIRIEPISAVSGEGRDVVDHGGPVLSLAGTNNHFHAASDRWPGNVNAANVAAIARAVSRWVIDTAAPAV